MAAGVAVAPLMGLAVAVAGLWHLGCTIAACLAATGFRVTAFDPDPGVVRGLRRITLPVEEPGLADLVEKGLASGALAFESEPAAITGADLLWIAFDTPVNERDESDAGWVAERADRLLGFLRAGAAVLVSSQVPVGFTRALGTRARAAGSAIRVAYSPENLRLGAAIESFYHPSRVVIGTETGAHDETVAAAFAGCRGDRLWMSLESAEMAKHALNAYLATSVVFINEIARVGERHGADAKDVERALRTEPRVGPHAYVSPGFAFAGGTLARDVRSLERLGGTAGVATPLLSAVLESNAEHASWLRRAVESVARSLEGRRVAILGLAYKPGTNTLRRSSALELCQWLVKRGATVRAHDPAITALPADADPRIQLADSPVDALAGADLAVLATPWPDYRSLTADDVVKAMKRPRVIDQGRFLAEALAGDSRIHYMGLGVPERRAEAGS